MKGYIALAAAHLAIAQAGAEKFSNDLKQRALDKWEKSKSLPRKQKKLMRKDANLDYQFGAWSEDLSNDIFRF
jgi:hypothetical protein